MRVITFSIVFLIILSGCTNDGDSGELISANPYFPLEVGKYVDYEVSETIYRDEGATIDTLMYFLREEVVSQRTNPTEELEFIIDRFTKSSLESPWNYTESWRALFSNNQVLRIEDNQTFVKLNLPITQGESWDGNAFFDPNNPKTIGGEIINYYKGWASNYLQTNGSESINGNSFENLVIVELANQENRIELRKATELYAEGIGLISKEIRVLDTQCFDGCESIPWEEKAQSGHIFTQHIIDYN